MSTEENVVWRGSPSQWINFGTYLLCLLIAGAVVPLYLFTQLGPIAFAFLALPAGFAAIQWLLTRCHVYEVTTERIRTITGLLSRTSTELELYRVRDYTVIRPFWLRLVGRGNLVLQTSDRSNPQLILRAIPAVESLKDQIRANTERLRLSRGVRDIEIDNP
ncbi:MAG TPA: PH domain-containing protein [Opitutaceae bacterium]